MCPTPYFVGRRPERVEMSDQGSTGRRQPCELCALHELQEIVQNIHGSCCQQTSTTDCKLIDLEVMYNLSRSAGLIGNDSICCGHNSSGYHPTTVKRNRRHFHKNDRKVRLQKSCDKQRNCYPLPKSDDNIVSILSQMKPLETNGVPLKSPFDLADTLPTTFMAEQMAPNSGSYVKSPLEAPPSFITESQSFLYPSSGFAPYSTHVQPVPTAAYQTGKHYYLPPPPLPPFSAFLSFPPPQYVTSYGERTSTTSVQGVSARNNTGLCYPQPRAPPYRHPLDTPLPKPPCLVRKTTSPEDCLPMCLSKGHLFNTPQDVTTVCGQMRNCALKQWSLHRTNRHLHDLCISLRPHCVCMNVMSGVAGGTVIKYVNNVRRLGDI